MLIDTHSHLFVEEFTEDLPLVMERAQKAGVSYIFMPNIDSTTIDAMLSVCRDYPGFCYPMIGLHPTSVNESYEQELAIVHKYLSTSREFVAIGEIGLDLSGRYSLYYTHRGKMNRSPRMPSLLRKVHLSLLPEVDYFYIHLE